MIREEGGVECSGEAMRIFNRSRQGSPSFSGSESLEVGVRDGAKEEPRPACRCIV